MITGKVDLKETGSNDVGWIQLARGIGQWRVVVNLIMKLRVS
jgi:hypothetical protein